MATNTATKTYRAEFPKASQANDFAKRIAEPGWQATNIKHRNGRRLVEWTGPDDWTYHLDMAETVGYYGSPPQGPVATLNGQKTPRSY